MSIFILQIEANPAVNSVDPQCSLANVEINVYMSTMRRNLNDADLHSRINSAYKKKYDSNMSKLICFYDRMRPN